MPVFGGFEAQYSEYGPRIRRKRALTTPERRRQSMPYALLDPDPFPIPFPIPIPMAARSSRRHDTVTWRTVRRIVTEPFCGKLTASGIGRRDRRSSARDRAPTLRPRRVSVTMTVARSHTGGPIR